MDGATAEEWEYIRKHTEDYREYAIDQALKSGKVEVIFTDGDIARAEMQRILAKRGTTGIQVVDIRRDGYSFVLESGFSLSDLCPVAKEQKLRGRAPAEDACPHLGKAIRAEIHCRVLAEV